jgi:hypothetical protein
MPKLYLLSNAPGQMEHYADAAQLGLRRQSKLVHLRTMQSSRPQHRCLAVWLLPWAALARNQRGTQWAEPAATTDGIDHRQAFGVALAVSLLIGVTLLASPRSASQLYFALTALLCCMPAAWITARLSHRGHCRLWCLNASVIAFLLTALGFFSVRTHREYAARTAIVTTAPPGTHDVVPRLSSVWWQYSLNDDWCNPSPRVRGTRTWLGVDQYCNALVATCEATTRKRLTAQCESTSSARTTNLFLSSKNQTN